MSDPLGTGTALVLYYKGHRDNCKPPTSPYLFLQFSQESMFCLGYDVFICVIGSIYFVFSHVYRANASSRQSGTRCGSSATLQPQSNPIFVKDLCAHSCKYAKKAFLFTLQGTIACKWNIPYPKPFRSVNRVVRIFLAADHYHNIKQSAFH